LPFTVIFELEFDTGLIIWTTEFSTCLKMRLRELVLLEGRAVAAADDVGASMLIVPKNSTTNPAKTMIVSSTLTVAFII
jgi:hypothetical protein